MNADQTRGDARSEPANALDDDDMVPVPDELMQKLLDIPRRVREES